MEYTPVQRMLLDSFILHFHSNAIFHCWQGAKSHINDPLIAMAIALPSILFSEFHWKAVFHLNISMVNGSYFANNFTLQRVHWEHNVFKMIYGVEVSFSLYIFQEIGGTTLALETALKAGFRHVVVNTVDTNELEVGHVVRRWTENKNLRREDFFITVKVRSV